MSNQEIADQIPAGPELDRLVAELLGVDIAILPEHQWRKNDRGEIDKFGMEADFHNGPFCERCKESYCLHCGDKPSATCAPAVMPYSTNIAHAWQVVEKVAGSGLDVHVGKCVTSPADAPFYECDISYQGENKGRGIGNTAPLAICRAALKMK